jgi:hypothetical protein
VVADARERLDRLGRDAIEDGGGVAQPLGEPAARLEVKVRVLRVGDLPVHLLDLSLELRGLDERRGVQLWQILRRLHGGFLAGHPDLPSLE